MSVKTPPTPSKARRVAVAAKRSAKLPGTTEQTLDRLCGVAADMIGVPFAALVLNQKGVSRIVASSGALDRYRSYRWDFEEASYGPADVRIVPDATGRPGKQKSARQLGLEKAGFFMRCPVRLADDYVLSLLLIDEEPRKKPTARELKLIDEVITLTGDVFDQDSPQLTDTTADVTVPRTLAQICKTVSDSERAEVLVDASLTAVAASSALAKLLGIDVAQLIGRNYREISFSGAEPIAIFCRSALKSRISPPDFEVTTKRPGEPPRNFQISVSPLSPTDTRDYFLNFRVTEITFRSEREAHLATLAHKFDVELHAAEPSFAFLQDTLVQRRALRARKALTYLTLRSWRRPIREYQIKALKALKVNVPSAMATAIAKEIAAEIRFLVGASAFRAIVPIPCGHTREAPCLSLEIARALGRELDLPVIQAFAPRALPGSSHPKEIKRRPPLTLVRDVHEPVLLIDDVATSGAHLEEASNLLKQHCGSLLAIAWIGGDTP